MLKPVQFAQSLARSVRARIAADDGSPRVSWGRHICKILAMGLLLLNAVSVQAQDVGLQWAKGIIETTAAGHARVYAIESDANKNVFVTGLFEGTIDLNPGTATANVTSAGLYDSFVVKLDQYGNFIWGKRYGSTGGDTGFGLHIDPSNNLFITGYISGTVDMNPNAGVNNLVTSGGSADGYILKLDNNGNYVWAQRMGNTGSGEYSFNVKTDPTGNVFVTGYISNLSASTFGPYSVTSAGLQDGFIAKLNASGVYQWVKRIGGPGTDAVFGIDIDAAGNIYIGGPSDGGTTGMAALGKGGYVIKLSPAGATLWSHLDVDSDYYRSVSLDSQGNIYVGSGSSATAIVTLVKLDNSGNRLWGKAFGRTWNYIDVGPDDHIYVGGAFTNPTTVGSFSFTANGGSDILLAEIDPNGDPIWAKSLGGTGSETVGWISAKNPGELLVGGFFQTTVDFDPSNCIANLTSKQTAGNASENFSAYAIKLTKNPLPAEFAVNSSSIAPLTQTACSLGIPDIITGNAVGITAPANFTTTIGYQWQKATSPTGPWTDIEGEVFKDLQPLSSNETLYYKRLIRARTTFCEFQTVGESDVATVTVGPNAAPSANADGPQWYVCGAGANTVSLNGSATGGTPGFTYQWYSGSSNGGTLVGSLANYTTAAVTVSTTYTLKVTDANGCIDTDQVTVVPAVANAGANASFCAGSGGVQIGSAPIASTSVQYAWTRVSGSAITTLSCTDCAQPIANPAVATVYRLTVTVTRKDGSTCLTTDDVTITPVAAPGGLANYAGADRTICINSNVQLGNITDATYSYTWTSGQFLNDPEVARPTFTAGSSGIDPCSITYTVTAIKSGCSFVDEVKVSVLNSQTSDTGDIECGPRWVTHEGFPNCPQAVYTWSIVSGNGVILNTRNGGEDAYLKSNVGTTKFRRTVTLNNVSCSSDVDIIVCGGNCDVEIETISSQGCPKNFGGGERLRLAPKNINTTDWNYRWSPANLVDNPTAREVAVLTDKPATITLTITNKYDASRTCSESIDINPAGWSKPNIDIPNKTICYDSPTAVGTPLGAGFAYTWTPSAGLSSASVNNPQATLMADQEYVVEILETASGCKTIDTVKVAVAQVVAAAGVDRTVCNGSTVTLGSPKPAGVNWIYAWEPAGAAWTNGTNASSPQPQVEYASTSSQTFSLTVTDPASGCSATDQVVLSNTLTPGEYTGSAVTICEGEEAQLGREPEANATYLWSPATALSCTNCANLVATPTSTTSYTLQITYPGCSSPLIDQVTVTVNEIPKPPLADVVQCTAGAVAIGFGAPNNPAAPAGATYLWSPATGLSNATAANPTANVSVRTTYAVTVTLASGCIYTDELDVIPTAGAGSDAAICSGESTQIGTPALDGATYSWSGIGIVGSSTVAQPIVKPTVTTTYTVAVTLGGCTRNDQVVVTVNSPSAFNIAGNTTICEGGSTVLSLVGAPAANTTWQWSPSAGVENPTETSTTVVAAGNTTYRLTQTNLTTGCSNFKEVVVVVKPNTIAATATPLEICDGTTTALPLNVTSGGTYQYVWSPSTGLSNAFVANPTVTTGISRTYSVTITDNVSHCQLTRSVPVTVKSAELCLPPVNLSGNVLHDGNSMTDITVNSTSAVPVPTGLYVSLIDSLGNIVKTVPVAANGTYDFGPTNPGEYSIVLHQNPAGSETPSLPAGWISTGENLGSGPGSDDDVNGVLNGVFVGNSDVSNANFGVQQPPSSDPKDFKIDQPGPGAEIALNGSHTSTGTGTSSPNQLTGNDPEDGPLNGGDKDKTVIITTLPDHGELWYNGVLVKTGQIIDNYDPALLVIKLTGTGYTSVQFEYAFQDESGEVSLPSTYKINWGDPLPVTLISFNVKQEGKTALLYWQTAAETNSDRFEIERSANGRKWDRIGTVQSHGESAVLENYSFKDNQPMDGDNFYRLKMIDKDLSFTYSGIRSASFEGGLLLTLYPNPVKDVLTVDTDQSNVKSITVTSKAGVVVYKGVAGRTIDVKQFAPGMYVVSVTYLDGSVKYQKFALAK
ncbi:Por secretion system C-terminal sorting domain-containing protein [Dyadobacter soli]|uniref:Por secretion system C-terminal sorting domain-containing protein n=1 Tax=Dyadobacter soli TaxID=659014 RepID=A0A1G7NY32_9BACT|nr:SBBP repeat-containing protein [Dyadobacter soli]SDF78777.1 Por secretion system C-terminal sorting domain-containing protein [Dyadobacter soli]